MIKGFVVTIDHGRLPPAGGPVKTRLAVRALVQRDGRFLMVHSTVGGDWKFPGGGVEPRESDHEALAREVLEETGFEIKGPTKLAGRAFERSEGREVPGSLFEMESRYFWASVEDTPGELSLDDYERELGFTPGWVTAAEVLAVNRDLVSSGRDLPRWLEREIRVLEWLVSTAPR
jgi:8-oxo-dGTP pyrophosphatase MutT (NUDIX family)